MNKIIYHAYKKKKKKKNFEVFNKNISKIFKRSQNFRDLKSVHKISCDYKLIQNHKLKFLEPSTNYLYIKK